MISLGILRVVLLLLLSFYQSLGSRSKRSSNQLGIDCWTAADTWLCADGINCIPHEWRCNGFSNCPDESDEQDCSDGMNCFDTGRWVPYSWMCNGYGNCPDASDENSCWCGTDQFRCNSGLCIPSAKYCDRNDDCGDLSDEPADDCICRATELTCFSYTNIFDKCVPASSVCDGVDDCIDGRDELVSRCQQSCLVDEVRCDTGVNVIDFVPCIHQSTVCDKYTDCADLSDENNCTAGDSCDDLRCRITAEDDVPVYICGSNVDTCDGYEDCTDGSDESAAQCGCSGGITCSLTGRCAQPSYAVECNGVNDCGDIRDWTDECYCGYGDYQVRYCDNTGRCLAPWQVCDGVDDCGDSSDEVGCGSYGIDCDYYPGKDFPCATSDGPDSSCINSMYVCDGYSDCSDASDEVMCHQSCGNNETRCATGTSNLPGFPICIPNAMWCDGVAQCVDHSDENSVLCQESCDSFPRVLTKRCQSGANNSLYICLNRTNYCDGLSVDCANNEDEGYCCASGDHRCQDNSVCIPSSWYCDGLDDCFDGSDEQCWSCDFDHFQCNNRRCINYQFFCDGYDDCYDYSDEPYDCNPITLPPCSDGQFRCSSGECILRSEVCDGEQHCDGSEEEAIFCSDWLNGLYDTTESEATLSNKSVRAPLGVILGAVFGAVGLIVIIVAVVAAIKMSAKPTNRQGRRQNNRNAIHSVDYNAQYAAAKNRQPRISTFPQAKVTPHSFTQLPASNPPSSNPPSTDIQVSQTNKDLEPPTNSFAPQIVPTTDPSTNTAAVGSAQSAVDPAIPTLPSSNEAIAPPSYSDLYTGGKVEAPQPVLPASVEPKATI